MKSTVYLPVLLAGVLAAAGAQGQSSTAAPTSNVPTQAGEASTQTKGVPNAKTSNSAASEAPMANKDASKDASKDAKSMGAAASSSMAPKAGEASTYVQGQPNADPTKPAAKTRAEVRAELMGRRAAFEAERRAMLSEKGAKHVTPSS